MATTRKGRGKAKPRPEPEMYTVYADILQETEATDEHEGAILINCGEAEKIWLPLSQIRYTGERGDTDVPIEMPDWLAKENGLADGQNDPDFRGVQGDDQAPPVSGAENAEGQSPQDDEGVINEAPAEPEAFTFTADVEHVYSEKYVLLVTNEQGGTASLEFGKDEVTYEGQDAIDLEEGYKDISFTVLWELAVEKHLPEFLGVAVAAPAADSSEWETALAVESAADDEREEPQARPYRHKLRSTTITAHVELSDAEKISYGKDLVKHLEAEADYKSTASDYSARARGEKKRADKIVDILSAGREERAIACDVVADYNRDQLVYVESEWPHREIRRERLTEKDRQLPLLTVEAPQAAPMEQEESAAPADAPEEALTEEPETVILYGIIIEGAEEHYIDFQVEWSDGTLSDISAPEAEVLSCGEVHFTMDFLEVSAAYAAANGLIEEVTEQRTCSGCAYSGSHCKGPEDPCWDCRHVPELPHFISHAEAHGAVERKSCGTCGHLHDAPEGDEPSPCAECGQDPDLPNWTGARVPADGLERQSEAGIVQ